MHHPPTCCRKGSQKEACHFSGCPFLAEDRGFFLPPFGGLFVDQSGRLDWLEVPGDGTIWFRNLLSWGWGWEGRAPMIHFRLPLFFFGCQVSLWKGLPNLPSKNGSWTNDGIECGCGVLQRHHLSRGASYSVWFAPYLGHCPPKGRFHGCLASCEKSDNAHTFAT